jgi:hypothetical protein
MISAGKTSQPRRQITQFAVALHALREASVTMLAAIATLACTFALARGPGPAVLAVVLCLSLSRSQLDRDLRGRIEAAVALPVVGLLAVGVGILLQRAPWLGALAFVAGMSVSIWLRRFGPVTRRIGSLIALPFVVLLTTPHIRVTAGSVIPAPLVPIVVALLALLWVGMLHALARRLRFLSSASASAHRAPAPPPTRESTMRPVASTRMAVQMAAALSASFIAGYVFFPERWAWIVLTAFIVISGNRGRLDVAYKSVLRVLGAAAGTILALTLARHAGSHETTAALILAAVFLGVWLRPLGYAWWALFATLALALLQGFAGASGLLLWLRLEEIVIGAIIGVASAWFVLPVRSTAVLRRRIADALAALARAMDPAATLRSADDFATAVDGVEQLMPAFRAMRLATRRFGTVQPADWVDALVACRAPAIALIENGDVPGAVRRAIGTTRKSIREPAKLLPALQDLRRSMSP